MKAIGIDLGGTKIETQVFDKNWLVVARNRVSTPNDYEKLVRVLAEQVSWGEQQAGISLPTGIGAAGLIHPQTGLALTANICASNKPLPDDVRLASGRPITYINDCRALALSETVFGAGQGYRTVLAVVLGTGISGGITVDGELLLGPTHTGGELGHISAPAYLLAKHDLPALSCGCGAIGCVETYLSGLGISRIAKALGGQVMGAPAIVEQRSSDATCAKVWEIWCELAADFIRTLTLTIDPDVIVLAGGLSRIDGLIDALVSAASKAQMGDFGFAPIVLAQGGDSSGARGAAYEACRVSKQELNAAEQG